jgi:hypothetical protein
MTASGTGARAFEVLLAPARERLRLEVVALGPRDVRADLGVQLVDGRLEVGPFGQRDELDAVEWFGRDLGASRLEHDLVLAARLVEAPVPDEVAGGSVVLADPSPERVAPEPAGVLGQSLVDPSPDAPAAMLRQHASHRVQAALDRGGTADAAAERLVAVQCEQERALGVRADEVRDLVHVEQVAGDPLENRRPLPVPARCRGRLESQLHV